MRHVIKKTFPMFAHFLVGAIVTLTLYPHHAQAAAASELERILTTLASNADSPNGSQPRVRLFQGEKLPETHPLANFHIIYDPVIDVIYLNTQKIDVSLVGDLIEATFIAKNRRQSFLAGHEESSREGNLVYFLGRSSKKTYIRLYNLQDKTSNLAAALRWNSRNEQAIRPTNSKITRYEVVVTAPLLATLDVDWRKYLPHSGMLSP